MACKGRENAREETGGRPQQAQSAQPHRARVVETKRDTAKARQESVHRAYIQIARAIAQCVERGRRAARRDDKAVDHAVARLVTEPDAHLLCVRRAAGHIESVRDAVPQGVHGHPATEAGFRAPHLRDRLKAYQPERVGVVRQPAHYIRHAVEVLARHRHGRGYAQRAAGPLLRRTNDLRDLGPQRIQRLLRTRASVGVPHTATLGRVHMNAQLEQAALDHQSREQVGATPERIAVGHQHGNEPERLRVLQQFDQFLGGAQRDFTVGELNVARMAERGTQRAHLRLDCLDRFRWYRVRLGIQIAAAAGEVAPRHRPDRRAAAVALPAKHLLRYTHRGIERFPIRREQPPGLVTNGTSNDVHQIAERGARQRMHSATSACDFAPHSPDC